MKVSVITFLALALPLAGAHPADSSLRSRASNCGVSGYDKGQPEAYSYSSKAKYASQAGCAARCAKASKCNSFAVGDGACLLYTSTVATNVRASSGSPYLFFDKYCIVNPPAASTRRPTGTRNPQASNSNGGGSNPTTPPSSGTCGRAGYDRGAPSAFYSSSKKANANFDGCSALCVSRSGCLSFAIGKKICLLYDAVVAGNFDASSKSPYTFYDLTCAVRPSSRPAVSSTPAVDSPSSSVVVPEVSSSVVVDVSSLPPSSSPEPTPSSTPAPTSSVQTEASSTPVPSSSAPHDASSSASGSVSESKSISTSVVSSGEPSSSASGVTSGAPSPSATQPSSTPASESISAVSSGISSVSASAQSSAASGTASVSGSVSGSGIISASVPSTSGLSASSTPAIASSATSSVPAVSQSSSVVGVSSISASSAASGVSSFSASGAVSSSAASLATASQSSGVLSSSSAGVPSQVSSVSSAVPSVSVPSTSSGPVSVASSTPVGSSVSVASSISIASSTAVPSVSSVSGSASSLPAESSASSASLVSISVGSASSSSAVVGQTSSSVSVSGGLSSSVIPSSVSSVAVVTSSGSVSVASSTPSTVPDVEVRFADGSVASTGRVNVTTDAGGHTVITFEPSGGTTPSVTVTLPLNYVSNPDGTYVYQSYVFVFGNGGSKHKRASECFYQVLMNNVLVYSVDIGTIPTDTFFYFTSSSFVFTGSSAIVLTLQVVCIPEALMPVVMGGGGTLGIAPPTSTSSAITASTPASSVQYSTTVLSVITSSAEPSSGFSTATVSASQASSSTEVVASSSAMSSAATFVTSSVPATASTVSSFISDLASSSTLSTVASSVVSSVSPSGTPSDGRITNFEDGTWGAWQFSPISATAYAWISDPGAGGSAFAGGIALDARSQDATLQARLPNFVTTDRLLYKMSLDAKFDSSGECAFDANAARGRMIFVGSRGDPIPTGSWTSLTGYFIGSGLTGDIVLNFFCRGVQTNLHFDNIVIEAVSQTPYVENSRVVGPNLIADAGFESGSLQSWPNFISSGATSNVQAGAGEGGSFGLVVDVDSASPAVEWDLSQSVPTVPGKVYRLSASIMFNMPYADTRCTLMAMLGTEGSPFITAFQYSFRPSSLDGNIWYPLSEVAPAQSTNGLITIRLVCSGTKPSFTMKVDNIGLAQVADDGSLQPVSIIPDSDFEAGNFLNYWNAVGGQNAETNINGPGFSSAKAFVANIDGSSGNGLTTYEFSQTYNEPGILYKLTVDVKLDNGCFFRAQNVIHDIVVVGLNGDSIVPGQWASFTGFFLGQTEQRLRFTVQCNNVVGTVSFDNFVVIKTSDKVYTPQTQSVGSNKVNNPGFESGSFGWQTKEQDLSMGFAPEFGRDDSYGTLTIVDLTSSSVSQATVELFQLQTLTRGKVYAISVDMYISPSAMNPAGCGMEAYIGTPSMTDPFPAMYNKQRAWIAQESNPPADTWITITGIIVAQRTSTLLDISLYCRPPGEPVNIRLDNVSALELESDCGSICAVPDDVIWA